MNPYLKISIWMGGVMIAAHALISLSLPALIQLAAMLALIVGAVFVWEEWLKRL